MPRAIIFLFAPLAAAGGGLEAAQGIFCNEDVDTLSTAADAGATGASPIHTSPRTNSQGTIHSDGVAANAGAARPHFIVTVFDDLGYNDIGPASTRRPYAPYTPTMAEMIDRGVRLENYYVQPLCSPTRGALFTGRYPIHYGGFNGVQMVNQATWVAPSEEFLSERLQKSGYSTRAAGKWHLGGSALKYAPTGRGFHEFYGLYQGGGDMWEHILYPGGDTHRCEDAQRRDQHGHEIPEWNAPAKGGSFFMQWGDTLAERVPHDFHHDKWDATGSGHHHETIWTDNCTHSTDVIAREGARMVMEHDATDLTRPLFLYLPFQAPHWPTQFYQGDAALNSHIPSPKRREFAAMITQIDTALRHVVEAFKRKGMWENTIVIGFADNGGDITTGASNHPYRGSKMTPFEGGAKSSSFIYSPNPLYMPDEARGTESWALAHVTDWWPTILGLAGVDSTPRDGDDPRDGHDVWAALVSGNSVKSPRTEMVYNIDGYDALYPAAAAAEKKDTDTVVRDGQLNFVTGDDSSMTPRKLSSGNIPEAYGAIRVGKYKIIQGHPGRGDWNGPDPSDAWPTNYIMGPDATDYSKVEKIGDGGQKEFGESGRNNGGKFDDSLLKTLWLFDLEADPYEHRDLSGDADYADVLADMKARLKAYADTMVPKISTTVNTKMKRTRETNPYTGTEHNTVDFWEGMGDQDARNPFAASASTAPKSKL